MIYYNCEGIFFFLQPFHVCLLMVCSIANFREEELACAFVTERHALECPQGIESPLRELGIAMQCSGPLAQVSHEIPLLQVIGAHFLYNLILADQATVLEHALHSVVKLYQFLL
jgi:hypothetical protein